jgi:hypothetical protein
VSAAVTPSGSVETGVGGATADRTGWLPAGIGLGGAVLLGAAYARSRRRTAPARHAA